MLGVKVVPVTKVAEGQAGTASKKTKKVSAYELFRATHYVCILTCQECFVPEMEGAADQDLEINVRTLTGTKIPISVTRLLK